MCSEIWSEAVCMVTNVPEFYFTVILDKGEIQRLEPIIDFMALEFCGYPPKGNEYIHSS